jgi:uncharacterized protein
LDVNLLLALVDPMHVHHEAAHRWFADVGQANWATCPITENGFVRVASHPNYPNRPGDATIVLAMLRQFCAHPGHTFWPDAIALRDLLAADTVITHKQITDVYLLGLAVHHQGKLATLDQRIPATAVTKGPAALELIK